MGQKLKVWHIVLFVAAATALGFSVWWSTSGPPKPKSTHRVVLVDVTTGDLFQFSTEKRAVIIPERNPDTGRIALFPVSKSEDGRWLIERRYLESLNEVEGEPVKLDARTGQVSVTSETPKSVGSAGSR